MKEPSTLRAKLSAYTAVAGTIAVAYSAKAQIIYTDVNPDVKILLGDTFNLDLNNDSIVDFFIDARKNAAQTWSKVEVTVTSVSNLNAVSATVGSLGYYYPLVLNNGDVINLSNQWIIAYPFATLAFLYSTGLTFGNFLGVEDGYMALKIQVQNMSGQLLYEGTLAGSSHNIDLDRNAFGVILISLKNQSAMVTRKLILD